MATLREYVDEKNLEEAREMPSEEASKKVAKLGSFREIPRPERLKKFTAGKYLPGGNLKEMGKYFEKYNTLADRFAGMKRNLSGIPGSARRGHIKRMESLNKTLQEMREKIRQYVKDMEKAKKKEAKFSTKKVKEIGKEIKKERKAGEKIVYKSKLAGRRAQKAKGAMETGEVWKKKVKEYAMKFKPGKIT